MALLAMGMVLAGAMEGQLAMASTETLELESDESFRVDAVLIEGLVRTHRDVVERELLFAEGEWTTIEEIEESVQRLRNTDIFERVEYGLVDRQIGALDDEGGDSEAQVVRLNLDERWTLTAFFQFGQGGDTFRIMVGAQDVNFRGRYRHLGGTYSRLGDANSMSMWYREPRFLGGRQKLSLRGDINSRLFTFFGRDGEVEGGYLRRRRRAVVGLEKEWRPRIMTGLHGSFSTHRFSYEQVDDRRREGQEQGSGLAPSAEVLRVGVSGRLGRLNRQGFLSTGTTLGLRVDQELQWGVDQRWAQRVETRLTHFSELPGQTTLGVRGELGFRTTEMEDEHFFAGGLDAVRGTLDMRHRGRHHWLGNVELRVPVVRNDWLVVQQATFVDAVGVTEHATQVLDLTAATTGVGMRVIFRDLHAMILRFDYALPVLGADGPAMSFGAGHFF